VLKGLSTEISLESWKTLKRHSFLLKNGLLSKFESKYLLDKYLMNHPTKKQTQKALIANNPAPAALSIPDDACHYAEDELRVLTVREMARIQSFPDYFKFRSKVTTGGQMRKSEVPQYTQVGNAVPPLLGEAIGKVVKQLL
jgi:DNA (cytosine-5)-methyltransferase 1